VIGELGVVHAGAPGSVGREELGLRDERDRPPAAAFGPVAKGCEIHVGGEVLFAEAVVNLGAVEALVVKIGA